VYKAEFFVTYFVRGGREGAIQGFRIARATVMGRSPKQTVLRAEAQLRQQLGRAWQYSLVSWSATLTGPCGLYNLPCRVGYLGGE
jgi:hypothetical protein